MTTLEIDSLQQRTVAQFSQPLESWEQLVITDVDTLEQVPLEISDRPESAMLVELRWTREFSHFAVFTAKSFGAETYNGTELYVLDVKDRAVNAVGAGFLLATGFRQTSDGGRIIFEAANLDEHSADSFETYILDITTADLRVFALEPPRDLWMPSLSSDGALLSFQDEEGRAVYDLKGRKIIRLPETFVKQLWPLDWSPRSLYGPGACGEGP